MEFRHHCFIIYTYYHFHFSTFPCQNVFSEYLVKTYFMMVAFGKHQFVYY